MNKNPFVEKWHESNVYLIGFARPMKNHLYWIGTGFKNLDMVKASPKRFASLAEAEDEIKHEILDHIKKWREDEVDLIFGWLEL